MTNANEIVSARALAELPAVSGNALPASVQVFPPGEAVPFTLSNHPGKSFLMKVDKEVAEKANAQLQTMLAKSRANKGAIPYADKNHEDGEATFHPTEFFWAGDDHQTGGVRVRGTWTGLGEWLIRARAFRYFSGNFLFQPSAKKFLGLVNENVGGLVNRPGFAVQAFAKAGGACPPKPADDFEAEVERLSAGGTPVIEACRQVCLRKPELYQKYLNRFR